MSILCDGGQELGFGHITRCISIAQAFLKHGYKSEFIVNGDNSIASILAHESYSLSHWQEDKELLKKLEKSSLILIDSMQISNSKLSEIEASNIPVIYLDDEKRHNILNKGFVVDWTVLSDKKWDLLQKKKEITYLLGSSYTPLREEFTKAQKTRINKEIQSILVTFGGADVRNLTPKVLKQLTKKFPDIQKNIIIGDGFDNKALIEEVQDDHTKLFNHVDATKMIELMQKSDLAIASGGQTLYELAYIGTPTIAILVVENAKDDTEGWASVGSLKNIGWYNEPHLLENLSTTIDSLQNENVRVKMQESAKEYIRCDGAAHLVNSILKDLK